METSTLPPEFLQPMMTALGQAWPRPRTRLCLSGIENVQKRMAEHRMVMNGIPYLKVDRALKEQKWKEAHQKGVAMERELQGYMDKLSRYPATKEQFKRPNVELSECCDSYVREGAPDQWNCAECGRVCMTYIRFEREDWEKEYKECMAAEEEERKAALEEVKKAPPPPKPRLEGSYLI